MNWKLVLGWSLGALLISSLACQAQIIPSDNLRESICGTVLLSADNRPVSGIRVELRPLNGGPPTTVVTGWDGEFQAAGLSSRTYVVAVGEPGYQLVQETVETGLSCHPGLVIYLKPTGSANPSQTGHVVSVRELGIPAKARHAFLKGLERRARKDPAGSLPHFQHAVKELPSYYEAYLQMGLAYMQLGQKTEAEQAIRKSIELSQGTYAEAYFSLGGILSDQDQFVEAEKATRQGLELAPGAWQGHFELGRALWGLNRTAEAEQDAKMAQSLKPNFAPVYLLLANVHMRTRDYRSLLKDLDSYLELEPNGPASSQASKMREKLAAALAESESSRAAVPAKP